jgi:hypothetical protein
MNPQERHLPSQLTQQKGDCSLISSRAIANFPLESDGLNDSPLRAQSSAADSSNGLGLGSWFHD